MRLLALDIAATTGFAFWPSERPMPECGSHKIRCDYLGERAAKFVDWLAPLIAAKEIDVLAIEAIVPMRGATSLDALEWLYGCSWRVKELCWRRNIQLLRVGVGQWRSFFIGRAHAPREIEKPKRRKWLKDAVKEKCRERGWSPCDDNAADALGLADYVRAKLDPDYGAATTPLMESAA